MHQVKQLLKVEWSSYIQKANNSKWVSTFNKSTKGRRKIWEKYLKNGIQSVLTKLWQIEQGSTLVLLQTTLGIATFSGRSRIDLLQPGHRSSAYGSRPFKKVFYQTTARSDSFHGRRKDFSRVRANNWFFQVVTKSIFPGGAKSIFPGGAKSIFQGGQQWRNFILLTRL